MQEIAGIPKIANRNSNFLTLQKSEFQKKTLTGIFGIVNGIGMPPPMGVPEIGTENWNSQPRLSLEQYRYLLISHSKLQRDLTLYTFELSHQLMQ